MDVMAFLWLNVVGCLLVILIAVILQNFKKTSIEASQN
jgi:hypothetical protein